MTHWPPPHPSRQPSPLPLVLAGAALAIAAWLAVERSGLLQPQPAVTPRAVEPRGSLTEFEQTTTRVFEHSAPSVVHITTEKLARTLRGLARQPEGSGTGFVWDDAGTVVTNYHVVQSVVESGSNLKVALGGELYDGTVIGTSPQNDIAVVRIVGAPKDVKPLPVGTSNDLKVGQFVLAIGNPYGFDSSLSTGIISALDRTIATENAQMSGLIQTDAAINPGNSGGPLLDSAGRVVGMNTAIYSPSGASAGIGFAVPVDVINEVVPALLDGRSAQRQMGVRIGETVRVDRSSGYSAGIPVMGVEKGTGAEQAGMRPFEFDRNGNIVAWGDILLDVDGQPVRSMADLKRQLRGRKLGETVAVKVLRAEERQQVVELRVTLK
jgi:S1-C subfamily serine protease